jgi:hypothetical protein
MPTLTIGLDTAKTCSIHGVDRHGKTVFSEILVGPRNWSFSQSLNPACLVLRHDPVLISGLAN